MKKIGDHLEGWLIKYIPALMGCWALQLIMGITVRNPLTVVLFVCIYFLNKWVFSFKFVKKPPILWILSIEAVPTLISALITYLLYGKLTAQFSSGIFKILTVFILFAGTYILLTLFCMALWILFRKDLFVKRQKTDKTPAGKPLTGAIEIKVFAVTAALCILGYLPYYLYEFPGIMTADSLVQFMQIIGAFEYSNHHPVVHTLLIKLFYRIGLALTGSKIYGIATYTFVQMMFMALCNGAAVREMVRIEGYLNVKHVVFAIIFFAFMPFNAVFAVTMWKDVPFAGIAVLLACNIVEMYRKRDENISVLKYISFFILSVLFMLFRSNAFFAMIPFMMVFIYAFRKKIVPAAITAFLAIITVVVIKGPVFDAFNVGSPDFTESLSVPLQQVARVLVEEGNVSDDELTQIDAVIDRTYVKELYAADFADNIKELVRAGHPEILEANKGQYLDLWFKLFLKNPVLYVRAWYDLTGGYIYPDVAYKVGDIDGIMSNEHGLISEPKIGGKFIKVKEILIKLSDFMPIYGMFFSIGAYFWGLVITMVLAIRRKKNILIHVLMLLLVATLLIASPVVDFRYGYAYVLTMPIWLALTLSENGKGSEEKL